MDTTEMIPVECVRNLAEEVQQLYEAIAARANHYFVARGTRSRCEAALQTQLRQMLRRRRNGVACPTYTGPPDSAGARRHVDHDAAERWSADLQNRRLSGVN